jgi:hypothetical protein
LKRDLLIDGLLAWLVSLTLVEQGKLTVEQPFDVAQRRGQVAIQDRPLPQDAKRFHECLLTSGLMYVAERELCPPGPAIRGATGALPDLGRLQINLAIADGLE